MEVQEEEEVDQELLIKDIMVVLEQVLEVEEQEKLFYVGGQKLVGATLIDEQGREVPRELVQKWVLLTRQYEATAATIIAAKNAAGQHRAALTRASKTITDGALVRHSDLDGWSLGGALKQAELSLERLRPWVVCPECDGTGGEQGAWCNYCGAAGWLCPADFERRVDAMKATSGKRGAR